MTKLKITNQVTVDGVERILNVRRDITDIRDRIYEPSLIRLASSMDNRAEVPIVLDQGSEGSCTGHGLAAVINYLKAKENLADFRSSRRMLYEMAKMHDEWPGEDYEGSSCRGAIRGWKNMGVCTEGSWSYVSNQTDQLTIDQAIEARSNTLGAYYRLRPEIVDYHAAINEVGAIYVSARIHEGWIDLSRPRARLAQIDLRGAPIGGHAFAIVGYNERGFIVQNSWGKGWGSKGFALWLYQDWIENISDGWVFRLALPTPEIFGQQVRSAISGDAEAKKRPPRRLEIAGHFTHFDNGAYDKRGAYWSSAIDIEQTAQRIANRFKNSDGKYQHLLIYAHGGLNDPKASARRIAALKNGFKRNKIYPFHIMYDTGLVKELTDLVVRAFTPSSERAEGMLDWIGEKISDRTDKLIEDIARKPGTAIWDEMKRDARRPFDGRLPNNAADGIHTIQSFASVLADTGVQIHLAGHSTGAILLGHLLSALDTLGHEELIKSCSLMAPACSIEFYKKHYAPRLKNQNDQNLVQLPRLNIYNLNDELELDDHVAYAYRKSLLYLVSKAFERKRDKPILGIARHSKNLSGAKFYVSNGKTGGVTRSTSHGGFDNDHRTMNHIMRTILGKKPELPYTPEEMEGY
jgi:hypothetical protein